MMACGVSAPRQLADLPNKLRVRKRAAELVVLEAGPDLLNCCMCLLVR